MYNRPRQRHRNCTASGQALVVCTQKVYMYSFGLLAFESTNLQQRYSDMDFDRGKKVGDRVVSLSEPYV